MLCHTQPKFHFLEWMLDWVMAICEVLSFQGNTDLVNVITTAAYALSSLANPLDVSVNVASDIRYVCVYVTCILIGFASFATVYRVTNRGYVEGLALSD
ncbi:hypothetical protein B5M09_008512 [Aphanomyces astaci]|nr:hypothetical protein B5M09_008512 [Aphanomyces astaci]